MNLFLKICILFYAVVGVKVVTASELKTGHLEGFVFDKNNGSSLPGVSVYFPDIKVGTLTDSNGHYFIENLPATPLVVKVSLLDFKLISETIDLSTQSKKDFQMEESIAELNEIIITGQTGYNEKNRTPVAITTISPNQLKELASSNIIDAIATHPGINQITTGSGISKPVIRGLGYNRVVVVNDGVRQEGQQWGDEHGIEIDEFGVNKVEIIKGPSSIEYGSDAMAGVVHFISAPAIAQGKIGGQVQTQYQTNNGLWGTSVNVAGKKNEVIWDMRFSKKIAHAYQNVYDGFVFNSGYNELNSSSTIGIHQSWGFTQLHFSTYNMNVGIIEGKRDSTTGNFLKEITVNDTVAATRIADENDFHSYGLQTPFQKIKHNKVVLNSSFFQKKGILKSTLAWQQNSRKEFAEVLHLNNYGLYFLLNTFNYDIRYQHKPKNNWDITFGINGMYQHSKNKGVEFLIPEYRLFDVGCFLISKKNFDKLDLCGGIRCDVRKEQTNDLWLNNNGVVISNPDSLSQHKFSAFQTSFQGISGSLGITYQFNNNIYSKLNFSKGFRAPNIGELASNGVHEGTMNYILGSSKLKAENSLQTDVSLGVNTKHFTSEVNLFYNNINHFIFQEKLVAQNGIDSLTEGYTTFHFASGNAQLLGGEISFDIHPHPFDWLHFENSFSFVQVTQLNQPDSTKYLPFTPPAKFSSEIRATKKKLGTLLTNSFVKVEANYFCEQNQYYSAFHTETKTPSYSLVNISMGTDLFAHSKMNIVLAINNVFDVAYQSHLSRLKYEEINLQTGRRGVYNIGRNVCLKLSYCFL